ncbi:MAG: hypothetical protein ABIO35_07265 [Nitrobacter sp.]
MSGTTTPHKAKGKKRKAAESGPPPAVAAAILSMVTQNLINMVGVVAVAGSVVLGLLAAKHL